MCRNTVYRCRSITRNMLYAVEKGGKVSDVYSVDLL